MKYDSYILFKTNWFIFVQLLRLPRLTISLPNY